MANTIDWGKATQNNTNGFGKYQNTIDAGSIYADSYAGETAIVGTSAAFSYSKSSYHQDEPDPTPTITGTTGGSFNASAGLVFVDTGTHNSTTGQIDLSASTIDSHIITYTVDGVQSGQTVGVTASPFIANTFSFNFDSASSQYIDLTQFDLGTINTISLWLNVSSITSAQTLLGEPSNVYKQSVVIQSSIIYIKDVSNSYKGWNLNLSSEFNLNNWHHFGIVRSGSTITFYINGVDQGAPNVESGTFLTNTKFRYLGVNYSTNTQFLNGKIDEFAAWNAALGETAIQEIYNATANNTGKALDLSTDYNNYTSSSNLQYWNRLGD